MILLIHSQARKPIAVKKRGVKLALTYSNCTDVLWDLAQKFPEEVIAWCEESLEEHLDPEAFSEIFHHDLIMASYSIKTRFLPEAIGYIDQLPFVNVNRNSHYATWQMSADLGGIKGKTLMRFQQMFGTIKDFQMLLNSIAKLGQQNGLFCYSARALIKKGNPALPFENAQPEITNTASQEMLFSFVYSHYKSIRLLILFWCFMRYEENFPLYSFLKAFSRKKYFQKEVDFFGLNLNSRRNFKMDNSIDVIIPTMARREYLLQVLEDLKQQTHLPNKVIIVEQNPDPDSATDLSELQNEEWPFEVVHHFIHQTGACNARNLALDAVTADWVFFADDDIRVRPDLLEKCLKELKRSGFACLNLNCKQEGEVTVFPKIKQWGSFGSGTSMVKADYCKKIRFDEVFEYGFGEDQDYGMQLRQAGCDIIYHPGIEILHLKAPRGGFREKIELPWEKDRPKPSPTLMAYMKKYYTLEQLRGYKNELFLRFYNKQELKDPKKYLRDMRRRWQESERWADKLKKGRSKSDLLNAT